MLSIVTGDRRVSVEYQGAQVVFTLGPENLDDQLQALRWAEDRGLLPTEIREGEGGVKQTFFKPSAMFSLERLSFMRRTRSWEGISGPDGKPLACNDDTKILVFGQYPALIFDLIIQMQSDIQGESKNSEPSQPG
jgi:hypothetical protein